jgi:hypothetical protein
MPKRSEDTEMVAQVPPHVMKALHDELLRTPIDSYKSFNSFCVFIMAKVAGGELTVPQSESMKGWAELLYTSLVTQIAEERALTPTAKEQAITDRLNSVRKLAEGGFAPDIAVGQDPEMIGGTRIELANKS